MIIVALSLVGLGLWTWICWQELSRLRREQSVAKRSWVGDMWAAARNRRAIVIVALWLSVLGYAIGSVQYLDVTLLDVTRVGTTAMRMALVVIGLWVVFGRR